MQFGNPHALADRQLWMPKFAYCLGFAASARDWFMPWGTFGPSQDGENLPG